MRAVILTSFGGLEALQLADMPVPFPGDGGAYVTTQPTGMPSAERGISAQAIQVQPDSAALGPLAEQAAAGDLTVRVAATVPLAEFRRGYDLLARGAVRGKVVIVIP
jgi:Zinc-binding dehydrogenase